MAILDPTDLEWLRGLYGDNPQLVGDDGHEDDFGDLINDVVDALGFQIDFESDEWQRIVEAASASEATTLEAFAEELQAAKLRAA